VALKPLIETTRCERQVGDLTWQVDVFHGDNEGLIVAEVESGGPVDDPENWGPAVRPAGTKRGRYRDFGI